MGNVQKHKDIKHIATQKEETTWCQNQTLMLQSFSQKIY